MGTVQKITLSASRDIPFNKLVLSQANVRRIKAGVSIEELAEDIVRRGLLQGLDVRPVLDVAGAETGMFEIPAGGRRYRALERLVKQKRLAKTAPVPCIVREGGIAEEDSLAENVQRAPLHPLDQFRAFLALREKGLSEEEIAAAFFVSVGVVRQRLKLASVSPRLLEIYAEDGLSLDQLMAFTVSSDPARQEQVFEQLPHARDAAPYVIRRMLTEGAVRALDKRVRFISLEAYLDAGGPVLRDLFQGDDGGWLEDAALVDRLVAEKLEREAEAIRAEGWNWVEVAPEFAYGHSFGMRPLRGEPVPLSEAQAVEREALQAEYDRLSEEYDAAEELPGEVDARFGELEAALESFEASQVAFDPVEIAKAGAFVSIGPEGNLRVERGYIRPEDEAPIPREEILAGDADQTMVETDASDGDVSTDVPEQDAEEDDARAPISDRLMAELTAHRTLGLRQALGEQPEVAFVAALHALTLKAFYPYGSDTCLDLDLKSVAFGAQAPGLNDSDPAVALRTAHDDWAKRLPREPEDLWNTLRSWSPDLRLSLFAHVVSLSVNAVREPYNRRPRALAHAGKLARAVKLDMAATGWRPTVDNFLGRVTKARILQAVSEAKGPHMSLRIEHLKRGDMAREAETLLADTGWLPEPLRTPGEEPAAAETAADGGETALGEEDGIAETDEPEGPSQAIAAE